MSAVAFNDYASLIGDGQSFIDAPVSGGVARARNADLQIMAGVVRPRR